MTPPPIFPRRPFILRIFLITDCPAGFLSQLPASKQNEPLPDTGISGEAATKKNLR
jgi:hypothetical protein